jgi:hypothetical protein
MSASNYPMNTTNTLSLELKFSPGEIQNLERLRELAAEHRAVTTECELAKERLPELIADEKRQREALRNTAPSRLLVFGDDIQAAFASLRKCELLIGALKGSLSQVETRLDVLTSDLRLAFQECFNELRTKVKSSFPLPTSRADKVSTNQGVVSKACASALARLSHFSGSTSVEKADALLSLCVECGAELEGRKPA